PWRGQQCRQRHAADRLGLGEEVPRLRQGDRQGDLGDRTAVRYDRRPDDLHAEGQAVHRHSDRFAQRAGRVRRTGAAMRSVNGLGIRDLGFGVALALTLAMRGGVPMHAQDETRNGEWRSSGGDSSYKRYSPLAQITRDNVKNLKIVWRRPA